MSQLKTKKEKQSQTLALTVARKLDEEKRTISTKTSTMKDTKENKQKKTPAETTTKRKSSSYKVTQHKHASNLIEIA